MSKQSKGNTDGERFAACKETDRTFSKLQLLCCINTRLMVIFNSDVLSYHYNIISFYDVSFLPVNHKLKLLTAV